MTRNFFMMALLLVVAACHNNKSADPSAAAKNPVIRTMPAARADLKGLAFSYQKDPACGMPLKAGLEDTVTYKGKLYGFCSKECKEAFLKEPATYMAQIK